MRVLVCGGRYFDSAEAFNWLEANAHDLVAEMMGKRAGVEIDTVIHGGATGADEGADQWARSEGMKVLAFPADWKKHGRAAGPIRNQRMIDEGRPDAVIAFHGGRGTADMIRRAEIAGLRVLRVVS